MRRLLNEREYLQVVSDFSSEGFKYEVSVQYPDGDFQPVVFPLRTDLMQPSVLALQRALVQVSALQELWMNMELRDTEQDGVYLLPHESIDETSSELRQELGIPDRQRVDIYVESHLAVGNRHFRIEAQASHPSFGRLPLSQRRGEVIVLSGGDYILLEREAARLLDRIEQIPSTGKEQFQYVAEVKELAKRAGVRLDEYLTREEFYYFQEVDLDVKSEVPDRLELVPKLEGLPSELDAMDLREGYAVRRTDNGGRQRIFASPSLRNGLNGLAGNLVLENSNVPRFIRNPEAFLPESLGLDLAKFSDRVRGLGIRVYQARPYVHMVPKGNGWFSFEAGVRLDDELGEMTAGDTEVNSSKIGCNDTPVLSVNAFEELVDAATLEDEWVLSNGKWIKLPSSSGQFITATQEARQFVVDGLVEPRHIRYMLDIYSNVDVLEYNRELALLFQELVDADRMPSDYSVPDRFTGSLRDYQIEGYGWMRWLVDSRLGGLLADEMGLGKTVQVIAFMAWLAEQGKLKPSLVIGPLALLDNWKSEIDRFMPNTKVYLHVGPKRIRDIEVLRSFEIVLVSYETLVRDELLLGQIGWNVIVCDEAQRIKNYTTSCCRVAKAMKAKIRLALTGTPVENGLGDLWSIVDYVQPGFLGSYQDFRKQYEIPLARAEGGEIAEAVEKKLSAHLFLIYKRRTKEQHVKDLPQKTESVVPVPMSPLQQALYSEVIDEVRSRKYGRGEILASIAKLFNICAHPSLYIQDFDDAPSDTLVETCPKLKKTIEWLAQIRDCQEKALVFTDKRKMQRILCRTISDVFGVFPPLINGETLQRFGTVDRFNSSKGFNVMILSPRAAGTGLNITGANNVIHYTRWWNPAVENQATDRVHRIGQTKPVTVYIPVASSNCGVTAEQVLDRLLRKKRALADRIIVPSDKLGITEDELAKELGLC